MTGQLFSNIYGLGPAAKAGSPFTITKLGFDREKDRSTVILQLSNVRSVGLDAKGWLGAD